MYLRKSIDLFLSVALIFTTVLVAAIPSHCQSTGQPIVKGELGARIDRFMSEVEESGFSGSLLVAKKDDIVFARGFGFADRGKQVRSTSHTIFDM